MLQHWAYSRNRPMTTDEKKKSLLYFGCDFSKKIINIVATRCHILKLKCTKFDFGWGSAADPSGGAYSAHPDPQLDLRGRR